ncbi:unnamed protein product [Bursaphelenchus okinawaensis]|uniref:Phosphoribosyltransferase domain-containing protein n=1 Tax=Bursaphelenchus okinawaensis TaxID=465554 RepID=A0A811JR70_9BILA|nr:unnamed protein product [Bursaphelenchus okinawaensis]CAG9079016.1 unnamed protein product [Bursaphelenchus okinawaensis]
MAVEDVEPTESNVVVLPPSEPLKELHTTLRNKDTDHSDFVFSADRLMRLVLEVGLNRLPYYPCQITTPTGHSYEGIQFAHGNCGVSVCRSGEAMEQALRQCCRSIRIGKILISDNQRILYTRFMGDIHRRRVLLLYPVLSTGVTVLNAILMLVKTSKVREDHIFLITLFARHKCIEEISKRYPKVTIVTSEICENVPSYFTTKYFGTD